jgi:D-aminopeptidase
MDIQYKEEVDAARAAWFPAAERTGERTVSYTSEDLLEVLKFFMFTH